MIHLGVDAVTWHARLAAGRIGFADVLAEAAEAGAAYVQTMLDYVREVPGGPAAVVELSRQHNLPLRINGGAIGRPSFDGDVARTVAAVEGWAAEAAALGSPSMMLYSGVYRPAIAGQRQEIAAELAFLGEVLAGAAPAAEQLGVTLLLENASDFTAAELETAVDAAPAAGVFLDLTNPYNVFDDPVAAVERLGPRAPSGHVKDFVLESLWSADHRHRTGFSLLFRYPGEGVAELDAILPALARTVGERDFHLAVEALDSASDVADQVPRLRASLDALRRHLAAS